MTTKEHILALREAYVACAEEIAPFSFQQTQPVKDKWLADARKRAVEKYPLPKKIVPQLVTVEDGYGISKYMIKNAGFMALRNYSLSETRGAWNGIMPLYVARELIANPTIEVEDDS